MCVRWTPTVRDVGVAENVIEGFDAKMELAMLAQRLDVMPAAVSREGEIDSDSDGASVAGMAGEIDDVSDHDGAAGSKDDADVTPVAAQIDLSEHVVVAAPEQHAETCVKQARDL